MNQRPLNAMSRDEWRQAIKNAREPDHDTVYFPEKYESSLKQSIYPGLLGDTIDNMQVFGLEVETLPRIELPIVCKKGDIFPLARDWK